MSSGPAISRRTAVSLAAAAIILPGRLRAELVRPRVRLQTALGAIDIEVRLDRAPLTGGDFLRYVDSGKYAGGRFFRAVRADNDANEHRITVIQAAVAPGVERFPPIQHETTLQTGLIHDTGAVSLGRTTPGTATASSFFICAEASPALDHGGLRNPDGLGFAAFGHVVGGMDVVRAINVLPTTGVSASAVMVGQILADPVSIERAAVVDGAAASRL
ncbi:peptidylprolyl isomerase [Sandaracinobacter sp. RS1-74]|uniref:peptidylprolyl isomerase n=1 Tax=Sandaracinobacteroides sayramensis TaxID=2913411 RepID=UPI001EDAD47C|nr:peptidylprolyl isomerase [Sandaracinobacteroides sayramensis]MCG2842579.1 peptidylprolyl isomerase [Sandaracinobacteroides sayramensis]